MPANRPPKPPKPPEHPGTPEPPDPRDHPDPREPRDSKATPESQAAPGSPGSAGSVPSPGERTGLPADADNEHDSHEGENPEPVRGADISKILEAWSYNPDQINARRIIADDGDERIQVRLDLGILQMHITGRPDGTRPMGFESLLEYFEAKLDEAREGGGKDPRSPRRPETQRPEKLDPEKLDPENSARETGESPPDEPDDEAPADSEALGHGVGDTEHHPDAESGSGIDDAKEETVRLSSDDCQSLREEAVQYYHRYVAMMALGDYYAVIRDTTRNLRVLDLCRDHAEDESDRQFLEQFRPYILMVRARALASQAITDNEPKAALHAIDEALEALKSHFEMEDEPNAFDMSGEVQMLRSMRDSLVPKLPISPMAELRARLAKAIETENYELAAILRDEMKQMKE